MNEWMIITALPSFITKALYISFTYLQQVYVGYNDISINHAGTVHDLKQNITC
jgi:hypothetical protein